MCFQTYEIQRPKICERLGSAARLKADLHPIGGRDSVVTTDDEVFEICLDTNGKRSPLWVWSTEMMSDWVLRAAPAPVTPVAKATTASEPTTPIMATFLTTPQLKRCATTAVLFVSISDFP